MVTLRLPNGVQLNFTPPQHVGQENFSPSKAVIVGRLTLIVPGKEPIWCPLTWMECDLQYIMLKYIRPAFEVPADYSLASPNEIRERTMESVSAKLQQALLSLDDQLNGQ